MLIGMIEAMCVWYMNSEQHSNYIVIDFRQVQKNEKFPGVLLQRSAFVHVDACIEVSRTKCQKGGGFLARQNGSF